MKLLEPKYRRLMRALAIPAALICVVSIIAMMTGAMALSYGGVAADDAGRLYLGRGGSIEVYEAGQKVDTINPQADKSFVFTVRDGQLVLSTGKTVITLDLQGSPIDQQEDADGLTFARVDADVDGLVDKEAESSELTLEPLEKLFRDALGDEQLKVKLQPLADGDLPLMLLEDEQMRRYREMAAMYGDNFKLPERAEVVLNSKCEAIRALAAVKDPELQKLLAKQYFDIARMSTRPLENEELSAFIRQSYQLAARLAEKED